MKNLEKVYSMPAFYPKIMQIHGKKDGRECWVNIPLNASENLESFTTEDQSDDLYKLLIELFVDNGICDCDEIIYYDENWNRVGISHFDNPNIIRWIKN